MATDLEAGTQQDEKALPRPSLMLTGLHIKGLKSISSLDLPQDGLGWNGPIPDFVMIGGINGSGKTTLLEFLVGAFDQLGSILDSTRFQELPAVLRAEEIRIDLRVSVPGFMEEEFRFLIGDATFLTENENGTWFGFEYLSPVRPHMGRFKFHGQSDNVLRLENMLFRAKKSERYSSPAVVFFPSERRTLISPATDYKSAGKLLDRITFVDRWSPPKHWDDSLESRLYGIRWEYLNAKEEGEIDAANGFEAYSNAFNRFFEGRKQLKWHRGELVVETKSGDIHDLSELSSGEKQVILFMGELLHRWRPGSLILIDEPELHLHESYQTKLWEALVAWQKERGGQVIVSTQSGHLFRLAHSAMKVLLSRQSR